LFAGEQVLPHLATAEEERQARWFLVWVLFCPATAYQNGKLHHWQLALLACCKLIYLLVMLFPTNF